MVSAPYNRRQVPNDTGCHYCWSSLSLNGRGVRVCVCVCVCVGVRRPGGQPLPMLTPRFNRSRRLATVWFPVSAWEFPFRDHLSYTGASLSLSLALSLSLSLSLCLLTISRSSAQFAKRQFFLSTRTRETVQFKRRLRTSSICNVIASKFVSILVCDQPLAIN